jgi:hypothetical protein
MIARCFLHSGSVGFHKILEQLFDHYLGKYFLVDQVSQFLLVIHQDLSADAYISDIPAQLSIRAKRSIAAFEAVGNRDLADITELRFLDVELEPADHLVYCFKRGWRFGLYFDLDPTPNRRLDSEKLYQDLGGYFRYLSFYDEYSTIEDSDLFDRLFADGWFPFMEIMGGDFNSLSDAYRHAEKAPGLHSDFLKMFDATRISMIAERWWQSRIFADKRSILQAGFDAYLTNSESGNINCIKTLQSEIDGVIRLEYFREKQKRPSFTDLVTYVREKANAKFRTADALGFPELFYRYLDEIVFRDFRLEDGHVELSRHSSLHGVVSGDQYTREKALQSILTMDQLCWYLR